MSNIFLIGPPASGKTSVGIGLAEHLGMAFVDTDDMIIESEGESINEIFNSRGERSFRDIERDTIQDVCDKFSGAIISTGGGSVLSSRTRALMRRSGKIVALLPSIRAIQKNTEKSHLRPSLLSTTPEALQSMLIQRMPHYLIADYVVAYDEETIGDLVVSVEKFLSSDNFRSKSV